MQDVLLLALGLQTSMRDKLYLDEMTYAVLKRLQKCLKSLKEISFFSFVRLHLQHFFLQVIIWIWAPFVLKIRFQTFLCY